MSDETKMRKQLREYLVREFGEPLKMSNFKFLRIVELMDTDGLCPCGQDDLKYLAILRFVKEGHPKYGKEFHVGNVCINHFLKEEPWKCESCNSELPITRRNENGLCYTCERQAKKDEEKKENDKRFLERIEEAKLQRNKFRGEATALRGKHEGKTMREIWQEDPEYFSWVKENFSKYGLHRDYQVFLDYLQTNPVPVSAKKVLDTIPFLSVLKHKDPKKFEQIEYGILLMLKAPEHILDKYLCGLNAESIHFDETD